jgi:arylformamidase
LLREMMSEIVDISLSISPKSVVWPTAPSPSLTRRLSIARGDLVNDSNLFMNVHTGTHLDAPLHHFEEGLAAHEMSLDSLLGEVWVADLSNDVDITVKALERVWPAGEIARILLKTRNSRLWAERHTDFTSDYSALTQESAAWLVDRCVRLVGIDYLSVQRFADPPTVHRVLLRAGVVLLEGLDLSGVAAGRWELLCLPLKLVGADGAPARAILRRLT